MSHQRTYFGALPRDVVLKVIGCLGAIIDFPFPSRNRPQHSLDAIQSKTDAVFKLYKLIFDKASPFYPAAAVTFANCMFHDHYESLPIIMNNQSLMVNAEIHGAQPEPFEHVLRTCGAHLKAVSFSGSSGINPEEAIKKHTNQFITAITNCCHAIETLKVGEKALYNHNLDRTNKLIHKLSTTLHLLHWNGRQHMSSIPDFSSLCNLRQFVCIFENSENTISMLKHFGGTLEVLEIEFDSMHKCDEVLAAIPIYCKRLTILWFSTYQMHVILGVFGQNRYVDLLSSYGKQLKRANTNELSNDNLRYIVEKCTNFKLSIDFEPMPNANITSEWERVGIMGPAMDSFTIHTYFFHGTQCSSAILGCNLLRVLNILDVGLGRVDVSLLDETIMNIFSTPFHHLEKLVISQFTASAQIIAQIASSTSILEEVSLTPSNEILHMNIFAPLVLSNPHLHDILLSSADVGDLFLRVCEQFVSVFSKCRKLDFSVTTKNARAIDMDEMRDICGRLPCRGVFVRLKRGDIEYVQSGEPLSWLN